MPDAAGPSFPVPTLIVPGLLNSGPGHWQSLWQAELPNAWRVEQSDWERPTLGEWTAGLAEAVRRRPGSLLIAHSLGCAAVAHLSHISAGRGILAAFLVAPADVNRDGPVGRLLEGFAPIPQTPLPFPSLVVASVNDPFVHIDRARAFARAWRSRFVDIGAAGHINVESGHGPWASGRLLLDDFVQGLKLESVPANR